MGTFNYSSKSAWRWDQRQFVQFWYQHKQRMRDNLKMNTERKREIAHEIKPQPKCKAIHRFGFYRLNENLNWNSFDFLVDSFLLFTLNKLIYTNTSPFHSRHGVVLILCHFKGKKAFWYRWNVYSETMSFDQRAMA